MKNKFVFIPNSNVLTNNSITIWAEKLSDLFTEWTFHSQKIKKRL